MPSSLDELRRKVIEENIRLHALEAKDYELLHPQMFNFYYQQKSRRDVAFICEELLKGKEGQRVEVLDLGCGTGFLTLRFLQRDGFNVTAVDISPEMLGVLQGKVPAAKKSRVRLVNQEIFEFTVQKEVDYDAVVMSALLHHVVDVEELIERSCALVRDGGFYYVAYEPLKQPIDLQMKFFFHSLIREVDQWLHKVYLKAKNVPMAADHEHSLADYRSTLGGLEAEIVVKTLKQKDFEIISVEKFCARSFGILAWLADAVIGSENTFSVTAKKRKAEN